MCTRYALQSPLDVLQRLFGFGEPLELQPRYNIGPAQDALAVYADENGQHHATMMRWGLQRATIDGPVVNVRSEGADSNPIFRDSTLSRRAIIVADGFYEWRTEGIQQPYYFQLEGGQPFGMAAIFDQDEDGIRRFALLTTDANENVAPVHDRMSVVLPPSEVDLWLRGAEPAKLIGPKARGSRLRSRKVDPAVNDVRAEGPELLQPPRQQSLF